MARHESLSIGDVLRYDQKHMVQLAGACKVGGTAGWVVAAAANTALVTCPASQTGSTLVAFLPGIKPRWKIKSFRLLGQIESAGNTVTLDAELRKHTAAAADVADASVASMTQVSVTADTVLDATNAKKVLATPETVGDDETFYLLITATTGASTDIALQAVEFTYDEV